MTHRPLFFTLIVALSTVSAIAIAQNATSNGPCGTSYNYTDGNRVVTSGYGARNSVTGSMGKPTSSFHRGVDIRVMHGEPPVAKAYADGKVVEVTNLGTYGNLVIIEHSNGFRTLYAHATGTTMKVNDTVTAGQVIASYSSTTNSGNSTAPHIHYETQVKDSTGKWIKVDPAIAEQLAAKGICPGSAAFTQQAVSQTVTKHGVNASRLVSTGGGGVAIGINVCTQDASKSKVDSDLK